MAKILLYAQGAAHMPGARRQMAIPCQVLTGLFLSAAVLFSCSGWVLYTSLEPRLAPTVERSCEVKAIRVDEA